MRPIIGFLRPEAGIIQQRRNPKIAKVRPTPADAAGALRLATTAVLPTEGIGLTELEITGENLIGRNLMNIEVLDDADSVARVAAATIAIEARDAVAARNAVRRRSRKTPMTPSQATRKRRLDPKRAPRERYDKNAYGQAVSRACKKAGVPHWHPNQLRHNMATKIRRHYGIEMARELLGHRSAGMTEVYAAQTLDRVVAIMSEIG